MAEHTEPTPSGDREAAIAELSTEFGALFSRVRRLFREAAETVAPGLQPVAYQTLGRIAGRDEATVSALAEAMDIDKSVISRAVRDLEQAALIERTTDPADRRSARIVVTQHGRERLDAARDPMREAFRTTLAEWSDNDIVSLTGLLHTLVEGPEGV